MDRLDDVIRELREFVRERDWEQFHDPKNLAMAVAAEAGELVAELRWVPGPEADDHCRDPAYREAIADEAADVAITLLMFADRVGLDLVAEARRKLEKQRAKYPADRVRGRWKSDG
jgi:NTP pyrophosphatase (non-canonical NTP hydrolase)